MATEALASRTAEARALRDEIIAEMEKAVARLTARLSFAVRLDAPFVLATHDGIMIVHDEGGRLRLAPVTSDLDAVPHMSLAEARRAAELWNASATTQVAAVHYRKLLVATRERYADAIVLLRGAVGAG